jgi:GntR family histidine utilization transcriptional repressor
VSSQPPLYEQVKHHVLARIRSGERRPGQRVQSEHELVRELKVSRMTANRALRELVQSGVLARIAGLGTFVADLPAAAHPLKIRNIASEIRARGHRHRAAVVSVERCAVPPAVRARLALPPRQRSVFHSVIVHHENDVPLQVEDRYVNPTVVPGYLRNDFTRITPHEFLMQAAPLQRAEHTVRAVIPDGRIRRMLKLDASDACLLIRRRTWAGGRIATAADLYHPGSRYELTGAFQG